MDAGAESGKFFLARGFWHQTTDQAARGFFQRSGGFSGFRIADYGAVGGIVRVFVYFCERQSFRIGPGRVPIISGKKNGAIGEQLIKILFVGQIFLAEHGVVPAAAENPAIAGMFLGVFAQDALDVGGIWPLRGWLGQG